MTSRYLVAFVRHTVDTICLKPSFRNQNLELIFNIYSREVLIERDESQVHFRIDEEALG